MLSLVIASFVLLFQVDSGYCGSCPLQGGKTTCVTEDLLEMLLRLGPKKSKTDFSNHPVFFASLTKRPTTVAVNEIVKFDDVRINRANGYNPTTGVFRAPRPGVYVMNCLVHADKGDHFGYQIDKNEQPYSRGYTSHADYGSHTFSLVMELAKGDRVTIKHRHNKTEHLAGDLYSNFSGYFLHE